MDSFRRDATPRTHLMCKEAQHHEAQSILFQAFGSGFATCSACQALRALRAESVLLKRSLPHCVLFAMGLGPSSEVKGNTVQLVFTTALCISGCCPGMKSLKGEVPGWLKGNFEKIVELGAPYSSCMCQMDCCGTPACPSPWEDENQNEPLKEMRKQFPQYTFTFRAEWVGFGKNANWQHVLQITNGPGGPGVAIGQVVGTPGQQQM
ncbi:unnamed protein product [Effrenium voratum]|nr:unnamed protein product [Effrenium voratum]